MMVLGPSLTYSCAVFEESMTTLGVAQAANHECSPASSTCGPGCAPSTSAAAGGSMLLHAAEHHGVGGSRGHAALNRRSPVRLVIAHPPVPGDTCHGPEAAQRAGEHPDHRPLGIARQMAVAN